MEIDLAARCRIDRRRAPSGGTSLLPLQPLSGRGAVLTDRGEIFAGCNVENASYGLTICAERNAVFQAVARSKAPLVIRAVVVFTPTAQPTAPCGACRQVINEFGPDADILSVCDGEAVIEIRLYELLPQAFGPANLKPVDHSENAAKP